MKCIVVGAACFIICLIIVIAIKAVNEAAVFIDDSFRWENGRDY